MTFFHMLFFFQEVPEFHTPLSGEKNGKLEQEQHHFHCLEVFLQLSLTMNIVQCVGS